ncbi:MAG: sugar phosphate isomerase/epimerase family protein, partial [Candidatus Latescibacteria bacterium]|nr:sugar phosphate isomerase/epimerase family protein [Candidatus Latescibacterota bacterium]
AAGLFGTDAILVVTGRATPEVYQLDGITRAVSGFKELGEVASDAGVRIGVETCPRLQKNLMTPYECLGFLEAVDNEAVGIYLDTANVLHSGYPEHFIRALGSRIVRIHFKDLAEREDGSTRPTYPGDGIIDWVPVMIECRAAGYDAWAIMEYGPPPGEQHSFELTQKAASSTRAVVDGGA